MRLVMVSKRDQFNPVFTVCNDDDDREEVIDNLLKPAGGDGIWGDVPLTKETSLLDELGKFHRHFMSTEKKIGGITLDE